MAETPNQRKMESRSELLVINGYSAAKGIGVGEYISSDAFTVGGYRWAIYFYPDGKSPEGNSIYVSAFIALVSEGEDVAALFEFTLIDQSGKGRHKVRTCFNKALPYTLSRRGSMWGYKRFSTRAALEVSDYLRDDCLKIYCTVGVFIPVVDYSRLCSSIHVPARSCSVTETMSGSNLFMIEGYSMAKGIGTGNHVASHIFRAGGYKWQIYFYPEGLISEDSSSFVSVFVKLASEGKDVEALFELTLMDQSGKGKHKVYTCLDQSLPRRLRCGNIWGYKRFFSRAMLETSDYLKDDCLKIYCAVGVVSAIGSSKFPSIQVPDSDVGSHIGMLLENKEGCDIKFNVSGEKLDAHKLILASRSPKLMSELVEGVATEEVMVPDMEPQVFKALLHFIYTDELAENEEIAESLTAKLLATASRFELERLKRLCESHLCSYVSVDSVLQVYALADCCDAAQLKDVCLKFAVQNLTAVMRSDGFEHLEEKCPSLKSQLLSIHKEVEEPKAAKVELELGLEGFKRLKIGR